MPKSSFDPSGPHAVVFEDVAYGGPPDARLLARVYAPEGEPGPFPALIDVHGGAWSAFDRTVDAYFDRALAACGMVVVALDFRQAPAHRYPTAVADVIAGVRFVRAHADRLRALPDPIGVVGGSSGGHLALLAATRPHAAEFGTTPVVGADAAAIDPALAYALALWPIADPGARYRYLLDRIAAPRPAVGRFFRPEVLKLGHDAFFGDEAIMDAASVPRLVAAGEAQRLPPIWVAHPELDENVTRPMSDALVETYRRAGGDAELAAFPGVGHAFANFPSPEADVCIAGMIAFVARQLARHGG